MSKWPSNAAGFGAVSYVSVSTSHGSSAEVDILGGVGTHQKNRHENVVKELFSTMMSANDPHFTMLLARDAGPRTTVMNSSEISILDWGTSEHVYALWVAKVLGRGTR